MTRLSVNVNKIALLRNSRGKNNPDLSQVARDILTFGAHGLTVHPRPDERHVRNADVPVLHQIVAEWNQDHSPVEFNVEGFPSDDFLKMMVAVRPHQCTLVPDPPEALTSNAGWAVAANADFLHQVIERLKSAEIRVSLFVEPAAMSVDDWTKLKNTGADRVELYTEAYADAFGTHRQKQTLQLYREAADSARNLGLGVNAGHDLNLRNLSPLVEAIPFLEEVSIGHALIGESLYQGLQSTIASYLRILKS